MSLSVHQIFLEKAEREVEQSTEQLESALNHLKEKVDDGMVLFQRVYEASKSPVTVMGITFLTGIFFGQLIRFSYSQKEKNRI